MKLNRTFSGHFSEHIDQSKVVASTELVVKRWISDNLNENRLFYRAINSNNIYLIRN